MPNSNASQQPSHPATPKVIVSGLALAFADGGVPTYVRALINGLSREFTQGKLRLMVAENTNLAGLRAGIAIETVPRLLPRSRPLLSEIFTDLAVGQTLARRYPAAVFFTPSDFWAFSAPRRRIAITHDVIQEVNPINAGSVVRRFHRRSCLRYARRATRWASISEFAAADVGAMVGHGRTPLALPNWVDQRFTDPVPDSVVAQLRTRLSLPERFYLYVGGYRKFKNVELLIRAHAAAAKRGVIPPLVLAGNVRNLNPLTQPCDVLGEIDRCQCPPGSVLLPGFVADNDLPALYAAATLFVSASLHEGFGYPPVEAMAVGCPVLVANRTSFTEVVPRAECRFDPNDEAGLSNRFVEAAADPSRFFCPFPAIYGPAAGVARVAALINSIA